MACRLCYEETEMLLPIYDEAGEDSMGMASSILSFLEVINNDYFSKICGNCWANVDNFQKFYNTIADKQTKNNMSLNEEIEEESFDYKADSVEIDLEFEESSNCEDFLPAESVENSEPHITPEKESLHMRIPFDRNRFPWRKSQVVKLIKEFRKRPELWHTKCIEYRDRNLKNNSLQDIAKIFDCTANDVLRKIGTIRAQFLSETAKSKSSTYKTKWAPYKSLLFLNECNEETININNYLDEASDDDADDCVAVAGRFEWCDMTVLQLIDECKKWPLLWDKSHPDCTSRQGKYESLHKISKKIGCTPNVAWEKFTNLKAFFYKDIRKMAKDPTYLTVWRYFKFLFYLKKNLNKSELLIVKNWEIESGYKARPTTTTTQRGLSKPTVQQSQTRTKFIWTKAKITHFICLCKNFPDIWNTNYSTHNDGKLVNKSMKKIADMVGCSPNEAHRKFYILHRYFQKEISKMNKQTYVNNNTYESKWSLLNEPHSSNERITEME